MSELPTKTSDLIDQLVTDLRPESRSRLLRSISLGVLSGAVVSGIVVGSLWGVRPDMAAALHTSTFWIKEFFVLSLAIVGFFIALKMARPDGQARGFIFLAIVIVLGLGTLAVLQLASAPTELWKRLIMGNTSAVCPWLILLLAIPIMLGLIWAMRRMAPTRLQFAGVAAGLTAGALSALIYSVSCDESTIPFIFIWYGGAIAVMAMIGAFVGPRVLRW
jgi:hypothetical protein